MSDPAIYTVGWICALEVEYIAAQLMLDEEHESSSAVSANDSNSYTLGKIGAHNVVIAVLPMGEYGTASAATVATNMLSSFINVKIGLMVGIGGGAPTAKHDIRLGDVVVGSPGAGRGGVFQYDFGKEIQDQTVLHTRHLNEPPQIFLTTLVKIKARYRMNGHCLEENINDILAKRKRLKRDFKRPEQNTDRLFKSDFVHDNSKECSSFCAKDSESLISRDERGENDDNPAIHYGLIASANRLMKDALTRDRFAQDHDVLCFEMEAAGLSNSFPCLIIRGICDYSDSHKNKDWQGYAAMVAAAYAKDILNAIQASRIEHEKKIADSMAVLVNIAQDQKDFIRDQRDISQKQLDLQQEAATQSLTKKQERCLQLFRLTKELKDITYEWFKDRVESRVIGTCQWLTEHEDFQRWLNQESGPLLISADPGCGKSVLAKYLIDERLPRAATICYFFFKDQDQNTVRQALCALIHQLISQTLCLIDHAMMEHKSNGDGIINSTSSLWSILEDCLQDPRAGPVIIVLDALDECAEAEFKNLVKNVENQFKQKPGTYPNLKYLLTSRPYEQVVSKFRAVTFPLIRIPGEENSEAISHEINLVIKHRVGKLADLRGLEENVEAHQIVKKHLENRLLEIPHRTYLWVYLVFDYLENDNFRKTISGVDSAIAVLPRSVNEAYEQILHKSPNHELTRRILNIILATMEAKRPLILTELNVALSIDLQLDTDAKKKSYDHIEMERDADFKISFRDACGLFVSVYKEKIYLIHQTAREFLLHIPQPLMSPLSQSGWRNSFTRENSHRTLAEICISYLELFNHNNWSHSDNLIHNPFCNKSSCKHIYHELTRDVPEGGYRFNVDLFFLNYSSRYWGLHFSMAGIHSDDYLTAQAMKICDELSRSSHAWFGIFWRSRYKWGIADYTSLMISSYLGHERVVERILLEGQIDVNSRDSMKRTALNWAAANGCEAIARLLLDKGADIEADDKYGSRPLIQAATNGHEAMIHLLVERNANIEAKDKNGQTALLSAARFGQEASVSILIEKGANLEAKEQSGCTSLSLAASSSHVDIVDLLLSKGANIESPDVNKRTPLFFAASRDREDVSKLPLHKGANIEARDTYGNTPLVWAAKNGSMANAQFLLESGADIGDGPRIKSGSALFWAVTNGYGDIVRLFLEWGFDIKATDREGALPLSWAAKAGQSLVTEIFLAQAAIDIEAKDKFGFTALALSVRGGYGSVAKLLIDAGADIEARDNHGYNPLALSARGVPPSKSTKLPEFEALTADLLSAGANIEAKDNNGFTPLSQAVRMGHVGIVQLLLEAGADIESKEIHGYTPLALSVLGGDHRSRERVTKSGNWWPGKTLAHERLIRLLLENGANIEAQDNCGLTPLALAEKYEQKEIVKLLLDAGAIQRHPI
ncbi:hypothetical protein N7456_002345 [Penicillium angulare]|uniref:Nucleoside phosphorylase domain-containing protein n=1 Tax=Penicillium angulare TaxID=116970 RepID=A0A9W9G844_9EURO|nr:hypothetical protein N7456_002345 [Penicillium angulare]